MLVDLAAASMENSGVTALLLALGLGFVSGLRTFTPVAAVMLVRGGIWGIVLAVAAVGEYVVDVLLKSPFEPGANKSHQTEADQCNVITALTVPSRNCRL